jgi:glycolate oxidase
MNNHRRQAIERGTGGAPLRAARRKPTPAEAALLRDLRSGLAAEQVVTAPEELVCYGFDAAADAVPGLPVAAVFPRSTAEVSHVVQAAGRHRRPIYTRGSGTNLSGGSTPVNGGLVVCLLDMNEIVEIDTVNLTATVQPGVIIKDLDDAAGKVGLMYPPDPGSVAVASMGGSVAECSGGLRGLKYGVTKDYVMGLEVVLADGRVLRSGGKTVKNVTGYDLVKLMVGSEGTLGIITEIVVKLRPRPGAMRSMLAYFDDQRVAANAAIAIVGAGVIPATLEFMDHITIAAVEDFTHVGLRKEAEAVLLVEVDGIPEVVEREAATVLAQLRAHGGDVQEARDAAERDALWAARRAALPAVARLRPTIIVEDATVPRSQIATMLDLVADIARRHDLTISVVGHAGDGNLHPSILCDKGDPEEMARVDVAIDELFAGTLRLGGTLSGEHGIGTSKQRYLPWEIGEVGVEVSQRIKRALDPHDLLNPGKVVTLAGTSA